MALKNLLNEVEFLTQYPMVGLAISDSSGPVPGYLFGEINAITYVDNGYNCKALVNFLVSRLNADTPIVCIKVLKLLSYLVINGHSQVIDEIKLHEVTLKEARRFNGPADDVYGNSFYQTTRKMAKELLETIFSENLERNENIPPADHMAFTGHGSDASSKKMAGFGYSVKTEKTVSDVVSDSFSSFVEKLFPSSEKETESTHVSHLSEALPKYKPLIVERASEKASGDSTSTVSSVTSIPKVQRKVKVHRPGRAGGGWESSSEEEDSNSSPAPVIEPISKEHSTSVDSLENSKSCEQSNLELAEEIKLVDGILSLQPVKKLQVPDIIEKSKKCSSLNCEQILKYALPKIVQLDEILQLRILIFIEYMLFYDAVPLDTLVNIVLPYLEKDLEQKDIKPSVKLKTAKLCRYIEILNKKFQPNASPAENKTQPMISS